MDANSARWLRVTPSTFPWEDEAIDFLRSGIADVDPNRGWSNFEFISGGVISEVDVFLLTRKGAFLIEIKSTPGRLVGDQQRWTFFRPDGGRTTLENPLLGANRKAKRVKSMLDRKWRAVAKPTAGSSPPFIQPLVFLSDPDLQVDLAPDARQYIYGRDGSNVVGRGALAGVRAAVTAIGAAEAANPRFRQLNAPMTSAIALAFEDIGIRESDHRRTVGSWILRLDSVTERPGIQDFVADHQSTKGVRRRIRIYSRQVLMSAEQAESLHRAADREFMATERLHDQNVVKALDKFDTDYGTAVVFPHEPSAERLDQWLALHDDLTIDDRLLVLRQLAETLQSVHRRRITHRALSPGSVLVRPGRQDEPAWVVLITDFSLAGRSLGGSSAASLSTQSRLGLPTAAPGDVDLLADEAAQLYQAPEQQTDDDPDGVGLDVFSFGALAYLVLSKQPPGDSRDAVRQRLQAGGGLQLAAVVPGVAGALHDLVVECTRPVVSDRMASFDDVLAGLDLAEDELTAPAALSADPAPATEIDPLDAKPNATLGDGVVVKRRLGRGSTALALLVERPGDVRPVEVVYKVALGGDADARLRDESRVLASLRHPGIVEHFGDTELAGRPVLIEALAGSQPLADELRKNGAPGIEFLERWGLDLLDTLRYLELVGRSHRDIKPDNLGVTEVGPNREQHLVLFDFSLAAVPSTDLRAGTPPYLDPFLGERQQWDLAAERYAAAVTLYEMATGETPQWGDGLSNPAFTTDEASLDTVLFDPAARDRLESFFRRALRRKPQERFGNAEEMLRAWQRVFENVAMPPEPADDATATTTITDLTEPLALPETLSLDDPLVSLSASPKVLSALNRLGVATVREVAGLAPVTVNRARRISPRVRRRIIEIRGALLHRFGDALAEATPRSATPTRAPNAPTTEAATAAAPRLDLDTLVTMLVPPVAKRGKPGAKQQAARMMLGADPVPAGTTSDWPSQTAIADALGLTRGRLGQIGPQLREYWAGLAPLRSVCDELVDLIASNGGVVAVRELEPLLVESRGSGLSPADARAVAGAVIRAAIEGEHTADESRIVVRRRVDRVLVALDIDPSVNGSGFDGAALTSFAASLGDRADEVVAAADDVIPQDRAVPALRSVSPPPELSIADGRLLRLAAAASQRAGLSIALELYPVTIDPVRALRLARQALVGTTKLSTDEVVARVRARFPDVRLPGRPSLDEALRAADVPLAWSDDENAFVARQETVGDLSTMTTFGRRRSTRASADVSLPLPTVEDDPHVAAAVEIEGRLERSWRGGGFLVLRSPASRGDTPTRARSFHRRPVPVRQRESRAVVPRRAARVGEPPTDRLVEARRGRSRRGRHDGPREPAHPHPGGGQPGARQRAERWRARARLESGGVGPL